MPAIQTLKLSHFRSHRLAVVDVAPGPVAIYGPNGAGKTNILEALSLLSPGRGLRRAARELRRGMSPGARQRDRATSRTN